MPTALLYCSFGSGPIVTRLNGQLSNQSYPQYKSAHLAPFQSSPDEVMLSRGQYSATDAFFITNK